MCQLTNAMNMVMTNPIIFDLLEASVPFPSTIIPHSHDAAKKDTMLPKMKVLIKKTLIQMSYRENTNNKLSFFTFDVRIQFCISTV